MAKPIRAGSPKKGPVLRFDFGVWQRGFAKPVEARDRRRPPRHLHAEHRARGRADESDDLSACRTRAAGPLTFDISAASPDFLLPHGRPVHFDIQVANAGPRPLEALLRFEVQDYLTRQPVGSKSTRIKLAAKDKMLLPTDVAVEKPGPYRAAIIVEEGGSAARSVGWVFTYDFEHYAPKRRGRPISSSSGTTRGPNRRPRRCVPS